MADLDKTGIETGEAITAEQITDLYDTLTGTKTYDNVKTLLGNIKEYLAFVEFDGSDWTLTDIKNTTGGTVAIDRGDNYYQSFTFTSYTLPADNKIFFTYTLSQSTITELENIIFFAPNKQSDSEFRFYYYDADGVAIENFTGSEISFWVRIIFYP